MLFNSLEYLFFLPIVFSLYWLIQQKLRLQNILILAVSYFFYGCWDYRFLSLIVISSLTDYLVGQQIGKATSQSSKNVLLGISLAVNLGFLLVFKYFNFFIESFTELSSLVGVQANVTSLNIILPVGISFYTFQTLSYTIDIYRGKLEPSKSIVNFFAYVSFFPQLVAGPIERASNLLPQFDKLRTFDYEKARDGMRQILWGLFKKVVIADNCALFVDQIFANYESLGGVVLVLGALLFAFQIYCDFSGYSDIAIGTARLLGFDLMQNFATPYFARDIAEFWRRWHISLSTWFRDYLYIPLGGSRVSKLLQVRNIFAIFLVSGFWHGANWTFIAWGLIHALLYMPQMFLGSNRKFLGAVAEKSHFPNFFELYRMVLTFSVVTIAWIFFRSNSISDSFGYIGNIFTSSEKPFRNIIRSLDLDMSLLKLLPLYIGILLITEWFNRKNPHGLSNMPHLVLRYAFYLVLCLLILQYFYGQSSFIYFQF